jgi:hypothetical protein
MCDDFFGDNFEDDFDSPNDDFQEDLAEESGEEWYDERDKVVDEPEDNTFSANRDECSSFDEAKVFIVGSMIAGNAYEEAIDKKQRQNSLKIKKSQK